MLKSILFATVVVATGCSKKEDKGAAPAGGEAAKPAGGEAAKPGAAPAAPAAEQGKATCDTILSKAIRDKYFAGYTIENVDFPVKHAGKCKLTAPDGKTFELDAACASFMKNAKEQMIEALKKQFPDYKEVPGAGDIAIARDMGHDLGLTQFTAYSKGSFCQAGSSLPASIDTAAFLTEWLASLPTS